MAIYHFQMKTLSRSAGRSATAAAAYRAGQKIEDERTGQTFDYSRKTGVLMAEVITPDGRPLDREQLWNAAETAENRCNSVVAREFVVALPHELSREQQESLVKGYAQGLSERMGWAVDVAIHEPGRAGDLRNVHAHLLCTTRTLEQDPAGCPVMGSKTREWDQRATGSELIRAERSEWEQCVNQALEKAYRVERVDCRSHAEKGTGLEPQIHLGVAVMGMERKGIATERGEQHREIAAHNDNVLQFREAQNARIDEAFEQTRWGLEKDKLRQMPLEQLQKEREKYRPQSVDALISQDPTVEAAAVEAQRLRHEHQKLEKSLGDNQYDTRQNDAAIGRYREEHPWKARLHDFQVLFDKELTERQKTGGALQADRAELDKALEKSQRENMKAVQGLDDAKAQALPQALRTHERQAEYFREVEAIYQPRKDREIAQEQARRREQEQAREKERQQERERGGGRGMSIGW